MTIKLSQCTFLIFYKCYFRFFHLKFQTLTLPSNYANFVSNFAGQLNKDLLAAKSELNLSVLNSHRWLPSETKLLIMGMDTYSSWSNIDGLKFTVDWNKFVFFSNRLIFRLIPRYLPSKTVAQLNTRIATLKKTVKSMQAREINEEMIKQWIENGKQPNSINDGEDKV